VTSADPIWQHFHLDANRLPLTGQNKVRVYFAQVRRALAGLARAVEQGTRISNAERHAVEYFARKLCDTFEILALRHFYPSQGPELRIDATDSGFVHFTTLLELAAELERRDADLAAIAEPRELVQRMLDQIVDHGLHPRELQATLMRRLYLQSLDGERLFRAFLPGKLEKLGTGEDAENYFWSFATYDRALNRPFIYLVYFGYEAGKKPLADDPKAFEEIRATAEHNAAGRVNLLGFSNQLDERLPRVRPRIVKRLVLGPYWAPGFTHTEGRLGELLDSLANRLPFALRWESETLISKRETRVGAGWLSKGQLRQVFWIPDQLDISARGVSQFERFVLLPHWLAQQVRAEGLLEDHRYLVLEGNERVRDLA
jgi:hypothetical protein